MKIPAKTLLAAAALAGLLSGCASQAPKKCTTCPAGKAEKANCGAKANCSSKNTCRAKGNCGAKAGCNSKNGCAAKKSS